MIPSVLAAVLAAGGAANLKVGGPVHLELRSYAARVELVEGPPGMVSASMPTRPGARIELDGAGQRIGVRVDGRRQVRDGTLRLELPPGSSADVTTVSGAIVASVPQLELRARTMSGAVEVHRAAELDAENIDGSVQSEDTTGALRIHTVSGAVRARSAVQLQAEVETSSGLVELRGPCGSGCRIDLDSVSGEVRLQLEKKSSFALRFVSHSGHLREQGKPARQAAEDSWIETTRGAGEGRIECETFSGDVRIDGD